MSSTLYTALGWAVVVGAGGVLYFYYNADDRSKRAFRARGNRAIQAVEEVAETRPARMRRRESKRSMESPSGDSSAPYKEATKARATASSTTREQPTASKAGKDRDNDDEAFAQALASKRKGQTFTSTSRNESRQKTVKQSNANKRAEESTASSAAGDAENDFLPLVSTPAPAAEPVTETAPDLPSGKDVSDMLEAPAPGPAVLRLTEPTQPVKQKQQREQKPAQVEETKKQRQNRKKKEDARLVREQQESERRSILESQRRTAREARGEPAKNGIPIPAAPSNAWTNGNHPHIPSNAGSNNQLLDTFAPDNVSTSSSVVAPETPASNSTNDGAWEYQLPDEEEQIRQLQEQDESNWTVAATKGRRKAVKQPSDLGGVEKQSAPAVQPVGNSATFNRLGGDVEA